MTNPETYDKLSKSSGNGHEKNMGVFPSGQWGQTVNLLLFSFGGSNPPAPTKQKKIRTYFRLEKGSDFSFSSGTTTKVPVDGAKLRYLVIDRKPITRFGGYDYEVR